MRSTMIWDDDKRPAMIRTPFHDKQLCDVADRLQWQVQRVGGCGTTCYAATGLGVTFIDRMSCECRH